MPRQPRSVHTPADQPVMLELPSGDRYHLHPRQADLEGYLAPDRVPRLKPGIAPIKVQVAHGEVGYLVSLGPNADESPDPGHRGPRRLRRKPRQ